MVVDQKAEERGVRRDGGGIVEIVVIGGPAKRGAQIGQFGPEPFVGIPLPGAVPQGQDVGFTPGEVGECAVRASVAAPRATSCSSAN